MRLAVKEVRKAEREKSLSVQPPGPGHYQDVSGPIDHLKTFSVKKSHFMSSSPRFVDKEEEKNQSQSLSLIREVDPNIPLYDSQMKEGP